MRIPGAIILGIITLLGVSMAQITNINEPASIYTENSDTVFVDDFVDDSRNPIRQGIDDLVHGNNQQGRGIGGIFRPQQIDDFGTAKNTTIGVIQLALNYALGLVSLIALIYLLVHGFIVMTALGDDAKVKKGLTGIRTAAIALAGIGLSRLLVSLIFYVIGLIVS